MVQKTDVLLYVCIKIDSIQIIFMNSLQLPPSLQENDKVLIISPSGKIDKRLLKGIKERLTSWGLQPLQGKHAAAKSGSFAGTIKQRLADLQYGLDRSDIKAIFCSRGGYGAIQLLEKLNLSLFRKNPKWLVGYSDITALHSLLQKEGFASLHAPMARHFTFEPKDDLAITFIKQILTGENMHYIIKGHKYNNKGRIQGVLRGGNLAVLQGLRNTPYEYDSKGTILYVEDVNETPNEVQRMFYNLKYSGVLDKLSGLILGQFTETFNNKNITEEVYKSIYPLLKSYKYPMLFNFPIGHVPKNYPLINGSLAELIVNRSTAELKFG